ncbi:GH39 family glycosyl hydrolase [Devosia riboflavina]|uniref:GH39 family glycosyl hydrolase n=1 Tax=Devosia riboflavina TaxID=46914 RepID=UPI000A3FBE3A|nr:glycosyl hydrolase [Devosia riboflavina]
MTSIQIDAAGPSKPFKRFWRASGFSPGELLLTPEMRATLAIVSGAPGHGVEFLRPHFMLELVRASRHGQRITYDWTLLDKAMDTMVEFGFRPFFEIMGNPSGVFTCFTEKDDILLWRDFVTALVERFVSRYGAEEVKKWYFETWNEPDLPWWQHGERGFLNYYDACVAGIDAVDPGLRIGGPGTARTMSDMFKAFIAHCDSGVSAVSGDGPPRLDFISIHEKGVQQHLEELTPDSLGICQREMLAVEHIRQHHPRLAHVPIVNNECDPQVGWRDTHSWNATSYVAALMARIIDQHQKLMVDDAGVDYELLANDNGFIGTWGHRTQLAYFGSKVYTKAQHEFVTDQSALGTEPVESRFSMVKKPSQAVMDMMGLLGEERLAYSPVGDRLGVIPTRHSDGRIAILLYNSVDRIRASGEEAVHLDLALPPGQYSYALHALSGDLAFGAWESMGAPAEPSDEQLARLRVLGEPLAMGGGRADGRLQLDLILELPSVHLLLIAPKSGAPTRPEVRFAEECRGLNGHRQVILGWAPAEGFARYSLAKATSPAGPFTPVSSHILAHVAQVDVPDDGCTIVITAESLDGQRSQETWQALPISSIKR